jgi:hypothetical protein
MAENRQLANAKCAKNDEFNTQYADIHEEVNAYLDIIWKQMASYRFAKCSLFFHFRGV